MQTTNLHFNQTEIDEWTAVLPDGRTAMIRGVSGALMDHYELHIGGRIEAKADTFESLHYFAASLA